MKSSLSTGAELPKLTTEVDDDGEDTSPNMVRPCSFAQRQCLVQIAGPEAGRSIDFTEVEELTIGRSSRCDLRIEHSSVSRVHAAIRRSNGVPIIEERGSANGTLLNGARLDGTAVLKDGDTIQIGSTFVLRYATIDYGIVDAGDEIQRSDAHRRAQSSPTPWSPETWRSKPVAQGVNYENAEHLERTLDKLRSLPPLVTSWEIEELKQEIAEAQEGKRFLLQGGDCAETLAECMPATITNKLKILIQMSLVLIHSARRPVIRVGRFAGQYAKPRSKPTEVRDGVELPSYLGDLVNRPEFTREARTPDPELLLTGYFHAAVTLNFIRSLASGGLANLRRPEFFDLSYFERAELPTSIRHDYGKMCREVAQGLEFLRAVGDRSADDLMRVNFYASHEGLNLVYEASQTRKVPRRDGYYDQTTHLPWIGERTRALDGAHIEFFRGIANPVAVKVGPKATGEEVVALCDALNPRNERGKLILVARLGVNNVASRLPVLVEAVERARRRVLWVSDPMHGNQLVTRSGTKTRDFEDVLSEIETSIDVHKRLGTVLGGVHFELTGDDVTECTGGGLTEEDLSRNYSTLCDPRLNYRQAIQMALSIAGRLSPGPRLPSIFPGAPPARA